MNKILCLLLVTTVTAAADSTQYVNFVRQIQADSGVEWDVSVAPSGSMLSQEGVGPAGSLFQLWSVHVLTANQFHLDEEFVSAYSPTATITIKTGDPYEHIPRTRVDQPFSVQIGVDGLIMGNGNGNGLGLGRGHGLGVLPASAGQVLLKHKVREYPTGQHSFSGVGEAAPLPGSDPAILDLYRILGTGMIASNGSFALNYPITNLTGPDLTKVEGEEVWSISALEGGDSGLPLLAGEVLESATLQIWPIADAVISGLDSGARYDDLPPVTVSLRDLYPDSTTFVRVFEGAPDARPAETMSVQASYVIIQDSIPQDRVLTLDDLDTYFPKSGAYTLEVVHQTPFGVEILNAFYPITIERSISIRGTIYSGE